MWIARSTSPPGGAGPSATSSGSIPRACASAGVISSARRISRRLIATALVRDAVLVEVRPKPALGALDRDSAPLGVFLELIPPDARYTEILAIAVAEIEARHRGRREHREILRERHLAGMTAEHVEQDRLQTVVRAGRIARRGADPLVLLADELFVRQMLVGVAPEALADLGVEHFGKALGQAVGQRLKQDVVIVVDRLLEPLEVRLEPVHPDRKTADPVFAIRIDEIGEAHVGPPFALLHLLAEEGQPGPVVPGEHKHVVAFTFAAPQANRRLGRDPALGNDLIEHLL